MNHSAAPDTPEAWVDAHHHLWDLRLHPHYGWLCGAQTEAHFGDYSAIKRDYLPADYRAALDGTEVIKSVHVEAGWSGSDPSTETRWLQTVGDATGFPTAIVVACRLEDDAAAALLDRHLDCDRVRGARQLLFSPSSLRRGELGAAALIEEPRWLRGFATLAQRGLTFDMQAVPAMMPAVQRLAARFESVPIVLTHLGLPHDRSEAGLAAWRSGLRQASRAANVFIKLSGLPMSDWHWSVASMRPLVDTALDLFGPSRMMLGSNLPVDSLHARPRELIDAYRACIGELSESERYGVLRGTAESVYRI